MTCEREGALSWCEVQELLRYLTFVPDGCPVVSEICVVLLFLVQILY
jgi:hypothetical protein